MDAITLAKQAAKVAIDKKAMRVIILDLVKSSDLCDFQMICSGTSDTQTQAIAEAIEAHFYTQLKIKPQSVEGKQNGHWILLDYGSLIVHIFFDYVRDYYALEKLWPNAKFIIPEQV